jgi:hypothetical protein
LLAEALRLNRLQVSNGTRLRRSAFLSNLPTLVICADAKPSIQARRRIHPTVAPAPRGGQLVEYERLGAVTYPGTLTRGTYAAVA